MTSPATPLYVALEQPCSGCGHRAAVHPYGWSKHARGACLVCSCVSFWRAGRPQAVTGASRPAGDRWRLAHVRCSACGHALRYHDAVACVLPWCDCLPYTPLGAGISARWHRGLLSIRDERPRPASPLRVQVVVVEDA